jgi:hypothetical protein
VHRVASLAKRWLLGTHQGAVEPDHLAKYRRVRLSLQPSQLAQPGTRLLANARAGRRPRPGALPPARHQPGAQGSASRPSHRARAPAQPGTTISRSAVATALPGVVRSDG